MKNIKTSKNFLNPVRPEDKFLIFGSPLIENDEIDEVVASMKSGWLSLGFLLGILYAAFGAKAALIVI